MDVKETDSAYIVEVDVPGLKKEDIKINLSSDSKILEISGERKTVETSEKNQMVFRERRFGQFMRKMRVPDNVVTQQISAKCTDGVLTVNLPKGEEQSPQRTITIE